MNNGPEKVEYGATLTPDRPTEMERRSLWVTSFLTAMNNGKLATDAALAADYGLTCFDQKFNPESE